jgi:hypothetical protein
VRFYQWAGQVERGRPGTEAMYIRLTLVVSGLVLRLVLRRADGHVLRRTLLHQQTLLEIRIGLVPKGERYSNEHITSTSPSIPR